MTSSQKFSCLFFLLFLICQQRSVAQNAAHLQPGYLIPLQGDTVRGFTEPPSRFISVQGINFRLSASSANQQYQPEQIRGFGFKGGKSYVSRPVLLGTRDTLSVFLEHLVAGVTNLYRLDYELQRSTDPLSSQQYISTFYYIDLNSAMPLLLKQETYKEILKTVFSACPTNSEKLITRFDEAHLVEAVLRYNQQCQTAIRPARDMRASVPADKVTRVVYSLRVGGGLNKLSYDQGSLLNADQANATLGPVAALQIRLATKYAISVATGLQYTRKRSTYARTHTVPAGFKNAGEVLTLTSSVQHSSLQVPLLLHYTIGRGQLQHYLFGGPIVDGNFARQTLLGVPVTIFTPSIGNEPGFLEQKQQDQSSTDRNFAVGIGGRFGAGVLLGKGRRNPLLEVYYDMGREIHNTPRVGTLQYRTLGAMLGLEL